MASIIGLERYEKHVVLSIKLDMDELTALKGRVDDIHLVPEENAEVKSNVYEKGKNGNTKYLLIPKSIRENIKIGKEASCLKICSKNKVVLAYIMDNLSLNNK